MFHPTIPVFNFLILVSVHDKWSYEIFIVILYLICILLPSPTPLHLVNYPPPSR